MFVATNLLAAISQRRYAIKRSSCFAKLSSCGVEGPYNADSSDAIARRSLDAVSKYMTHDPNPGRQPLLWAGLVFSAGLWVGARAWRPATWWIVAVLGFALAAVWFLRRRSWIAKGFSLGTWFVLGAFLIQIRGAGW